MLVIQACRGRSGKFFKKPRCEGYPRYAGIREHLSRAAARDSGNTLDNKEFLGGVLAIVERTRRSAWPRGRSAFCYLTRSTVTRRAPARKATRWIWRKSAPRNLQNEKIVSHLRLALRAIPNPAGFGETSDQRRYFVPCPHCDEMQILEWGRLEI